MKVLLTGAAGLLGGYLLRSVPAGSTVLPIYHKSGVKEKLDALRVDIGSLEEVDRCVSFARPDWIIHAAALGSPDYCEENQAEAWKVNVEGTKNLAKACKKNGSHLLYVSSNGVFEGTKAPYAEEAVPKPVNYYGLTKFEGEKIVQEADSQWPIVRPNLIYGWHGPETRVNLATYFLSTLSKEKPVNAIKDLYFSPVPAWQCAEAIWKVISEEKTGLWHVGGAETVSPWDMAVMAARVFGLDKSLIREASWKDFPVKAPRPLNTAFKTEKMRMKLGLEPAALEEGMSEMRREMAAKIS